MRTVRLSAAMLCLWLAGGAALLAEPTTAPATRPTTAPAASPEQIRAWIANLADEQFAVREDAAAQLRRIGRAAAPELERAAAATADPDLRQQIKLLLDRVLAKGNATSILLKGVREVGTGTLSMQTGTFRLQYKQDEGTVSARLVDGEQEVSVEESAQEVRVTVGKPGEGPVQVYAAKNLDELAELYPEGSELYRRHSTHALEIFQSQMARMQQTRLMNAQLRAKAAEKNKAPAGD
jgi:hypothetical protein